MRRNDVRYDRDTDRIILDMHSYNSGLIPVALTRQEAETLASTIGSALVMARMFDAAAKSGPAKPHP